MQGRYRVSINGFRCSAETWDDALNWDGRHDEVFLSSSVKVANADGSVVYESISQSPVLGDTWQLPNRVQAGSASDRGGIISGDSYPTGTPWIRSQPLATERDYPPMAIWEGDLVQGQTVAFIT